VIKLPNNRRIVVDAKFPGVQKYLEAIQSTSEDERKQKMGIYVQQLKECMQKLSQKAYYAQFDFTPEFVILFLPSEALLSAALQEDPTLIEYGSQENVMVATPTTLIALLKTVAYGWKQEQLTREARLVYTLGNSLHERLVLFYGYFGELRNQLSKSVDAYNKITSSLETRLLPVARKFHALYETEESAMNYPEPIEKSLKSLKGEEDATLV
jgi:DNA recombination protein RmuC